MNTAPDSTVSVQISTYVLLLAYSLLERSIVGLLFATTGGGGGVAVVHVKQNRPNDRPVLIRFPNLGIEVGIFKKKE